MLAGVGVRQPGTMPTSGRTSQFGDFGPFQSKNNNDEIPALGQSFASSSKPWGPSIWGSNPIGSGFASTARDATSRGRENGQYPSTTTDGEAKKGSASLVASSESDTWGRQRSPWGTADANATAKAPLSIPRSSGVSPSRPLNNGQAQAQQPYIEPSQAASSYFAAPRAGSISHTSSNSMARPRLDPTSGSFSIGRPQDGMSNGFPTFGRFSEVDAQAAQQAVQRVAEQSANNWVTDASSVHSPTDDRRSVTNSDYFVSSSAGPSRSGSLPPSRHGTDPPHMPQAADAFARFSQMPPHSRAHNASFSGPATGRAFAERSGSIQSESLGMFSRLTLDNDTDHSVGGFKQSGNVNGAVTFDSPQAYEQPTDVQQSMVRHEDGPLNGGVPFPSDVLSNGIYNEALLQARGLQYNRMQQITPAGSSFRQSPYNSHTATPPAFDHLYPSRSEQHTRTQSTQSAVNPLTLDRKLQNIQSFQLSQEQQRLMAQYPQMVAAAAGQFRNPYQYYAMPGLMNMSPMHPGLQLPTIPTPFAAPYVEVPSGPRDQMPTDMRSKCLDDFKANNKTNKKYELKDIYDHIAEFSGDQHGSRFIQSKLETANSEEKERVFREIYPESLPLMQDVFGNYVIQKFFEHGDQSQKKALAGKMKGNMLSLSLQMYGCRVVQKALEHILSDQQASLVKELESHVLKCVKDQNGNHVIQKAIERVPPEHIQFIFKAFTGQVGTLATHAYGCRVIQRMLEHCEPATRNSILQELHLCGASLITDSYGNYVTQHIIEHGGPEDRAKVIHLIRDQLISYSKHKFASNVVEKCLVFGTEEQRHDIMMKIVEKNERGESSLLGLIKDGYGNYVIQKLLDTLGPADYAIFVENLQPEMLKAKRLISGKHVQAVEKKMHRFDRYDVLPDNPCRSSISTTGTSTDRSAAATPPPLTNDTQSPKSASVPSASNSTAGEPAPTSSTTPAKAAAAAAATTTTLQDGGVALGINEAA